MLELHYDENSGIWGHIFNIAYQYRKIAQMAKKTLKETLRLIYYVSIAEKILDFGVN
jgi:hypothetical protein